MPKQYICVIPTMEPGFRIVGPFSDPDEAANTTEGQLGWIMSLQSPQDYLAEQQQLEDEKTREKLWGAD